MGIFGDIGQGLGAIGGALGPFGGPIGAGLSGVGAGLSLLDPSDPDAVVLTPWEARGASEFYEPGNVLWGLPPHAEDLAFDRGMVKIGVTTSDTRAAGASQRRARLTREWERRGRRADRFHFEIRNGRRSSALVWDTKRWTNPRWTTPRAVLESISPGGGSGKGYGGLTIKAGRYNELVARFRQQADDHGDAAPVFWYLDLRPFEEWARDRWHRSINSLTYQGNQDVRFSRWLTTPYYGGALQAEYDEFHADELQRQANDTEAWYNWRESNALQIEQQAQAEQVAAFQAAVFAAELAALELQQAGLEPDPVPELQPPQQGAPYIPPPPSGAPAAPELVEDVADAGAGYPAGYQAAAAQVAPGAPVALLVAGGVAAAGIGYLALRK